MDVTEFRKNRLNYPKYFLLLPKPLRTYVATLRYVLPINSVFNVLACLAQGAHNRL